MIITQTVCEKVRFPIASVQWTMYAAETVVCAIALASLFALNINTTSAALTGLIFTRDGYYPGDNKILTVARFAVSFTIVYYFLYLLPILKWPLILINGARLIGMVLNDIDYLRQKAQTMSMTDAIKAKALCKGIFIFKLANGAERRAGVYYDGGRTVSISSATGISMSQGIIILSGFDLPDACVEYIENLLPDEHRGKCCCLRTGLDDSAAEACSTGRTQVIDLQDVQVEDASAMFTEMIG